MRLLELASVRTGLLLSRKASIAIDKHKISYKVLNLKCIKDTGVIDESYIETFYSTEILKPNYLTRVNDIIIRLSHPYTAVLITEETVGIVIPSHFVVVRTQTAKLSPSYLYWLLNTDKLKREMLKNNSGSFLGTIKPKYISEIEIKLLPIEKQNIIAELNMLAKKEIQLLEDLKKQKQLYYTHLTNKIQKQMRRGN